MRICGGLSAARCRRVDILGQGPETDLAGFERFDGFDKLFQRPRQAIQLPDNQRVAFPDILKGGLQLRPLPLRAGGPFNKTALTVRRRQRIKLKLGVLVLC